MLRPVMLVTSTTPVRLDAVMESPIRRREIMYNLWQLQDCHREKTKSEKMVKRPHDHARSHEQHGKRSQHYHAVDAVAGATHAKRLGSRQLLATTRHEWCQ